VDVVDFHRWCTRWWDEVEVYHDTAAYGQAL